MDVSDGLAGDLAKLCRASSVAAEIDVARVPLSDAARAALAADPALLETVLSGGDDYEIVLTLAPEKLGAFLRPPRAAGVATAEIGRVTAGEGARFMRDGNPLSFAHGLLQSFLKMRSLAAALMVLLALGNSGVVVPPRRRHCALFWRRRSSKKAPAPMAATRR